MRSAAGVALVAAGAAFSSAGCAGGGAGPETRVWSSSSSSDGFSSCPSNTVVVGGGHEVEESLQQAGKWPRVAVSRPYGNGWQVVCTDEHGVPMAGCKAWVVCASVLK